jgi:DNA-binding NarL/FixJ family response regulator
MRKLRVLLADDHNLIRAGLRLVISQAPDFVVVGEAENGRQAVEKARELKPDVVVMDIGMPDLNGIEACRQIVDSPTETQVVMLSMHSDEGYVLRALKAGARAYLLKDSAEADLARAIRAAAEGKSFFSPAVAKLLLDDYMRKLQRTGVEDSYELLTPREREILQLVAEGKSSKDIANLLTLSVYTVETHRANILQKLNLKSAAELILYAVRKGIIS